MKYYTGVGSRETPSEICTIFQEIGETLAKQGYILRSGAATGADTAFEVGCDIAKGKKKIFIPWSNFNKSTSTLIGANEEALKIAEEVIPWWNTLKKWPQILHGRNAYQVLGQDLNTPSDFVICWTDGGKLIGGTRTAIKIAQKNNIRVYNFGLVEHIKQFEQEFNFKFEDIYVDF